MSRTEEIVEGTLLPDGTLTLDREPQLPPGRVRVVIQVEAANRRRGLADVIREIEAGQQERGFAGRTGQEIQAEAEARLAEDEEYERRVDALRAQTGPQERP